jgi:transcriptional regulator with XRE-family HTH domain
MLKKIENLCKKRNITIYKLEKICGFSLNSITKWNTSSPSAEKLAKVANYFDVSTDYLLGLTDIQNSAEKPPKPIAKNAMNFDRFKDLRVEMNVTEDDLKGLTDEKLKIIVYALKSRL